MLKRRIKAGMDKAKALGTRSGAPIGRPRITAEQQSGIRSLRREGRSYREISERLELSKSVVYRYLKASACRRQAVLPEPFLVGLCPGRHTTGLTVMAAWP